MGLDRRAHDRGLQALVKQEERRGSRDGAVISSPL